LVAALISSMGAVASAQDLPVSKAESKLVTERGTLSGYGERCGLDWRRLNFLPMMSYWRSQGKNERQMAFIGVLHGAAQGYAAKAAPPCSAENVRRLREQLIFKP